MVILVLKVLCANIYSTRTNIKFCCVSVLMLKMLKYTVSFNVILLKVVVSDDELFSF